MNPGAVDFKAKVISAENDIFPDAPMAQKRDHGVCDSWNNDKYTCLV